MIYPINLNLIIFNASELTNKIILIHNEGGFVQGFNTAAKNLSAGTSGIYFRILVVALFVFNDPRLIAAVYVYQKSSTSFAFFIHNPDGFRQETCLEEEKTQGFLWMKSINNEHVHHQ